MHITRATLSEAVSKGLIAEEQGQALWAYLVDREEDRERETPSFKPAHILYYLGGMIAVGAMTLFMTLGWEQFGGGGLLSIAVVYAAVMLLLTEYLLRRRQLALPAGITATLAVVMVPLGIYGLQHVLGLWPEDESKGWGYRNYHTHIDWRWLLMELATLAAGAAALRRYRLPFLVMPVAVTLWYMSMDIVPFLFVGDSGGEAWAFFSDAGKRISFAFGLVMVLIAFWVDIRSRPPKDFAFWLYLFGVLACWRSGAR